MHTLWNSFLNDEAGFIVSAELILIATISVLALIVGLTEVAYAVNEELEDVGSAFGAVNQTYCFRGVGGHKAEIGGSRFHDNVDFCDSEFDITCDGHPLGECGHSSGGGYGGGYGGGHGGGW